jgi:hypothetical protein
MRSTAIEIRTTRVTGDSRDRVYFHWVCSSRCKGWKVKWTLVQALRPCTGHTAHRGSRGIALFNHDHGTRRGWGVSVTPQPLFTPGKDPVFIVQEAGWTTGPVWTGAENLALTGIRSPDRPARSQSLYRLRYPAHSSGCCSSKNVLRMEVRAYRGPHTKGLPNTGGLKSLRLSCCPNVHEVRARATI